MKIELNSEQLSNIKKIELDILKEVDRICKKNNIKYTIFWGTLIGQVRHKGFIPWDDDIDIVLTIDQYDKFINCVNKEINSKFFYFVDYHNYKEYGLPFGKMMAKNTTMKEVSISKNNSPDGIFVDIIPIYPSPNDEKEREKMYYDAKKIYKKILCKTNYTFSDNVIRRILYRAKKILYLNKTKTKLINEFEKNARKYINTSFNNYIALCMTSSIEKAIFPKKYFKKYINVNFENLIVSSIKNSDEVLKISYGNYLKLPPKEKQVSHHYVVKIDYNNYYKN